MCNKIPYPSKEAALININEIRFSNRKHSKSRKRTNKKDRMDLYAYSCSLCDKWHLSTMKQNNNKR